MLDPLVEKSVKTSRLRFLRAYWVTYRILVRYLFLFLVRRIISRERAEDLMNRVHQKTARKIVKNILLLKGLYIKIGQTLSIMTNFLPPAFLTELESLQDSVPPHPYEEVCARFLADLGKTPEEMFDRFDPKPIASASLAQVHVARLKDKTKLAVKLQYPDIDDVVKKDLKVIRRIFGTIDFIFPQYGLKQVYAECAQMILQELDFTTEGKNLEKIRDNFRDQPQYIFPKIYWDTSSPKILTAGFVDGIKVTNLDGLKQAGINAHDVAVSLIHMYCKQIFIDGVYHADPHPGNIIVIPYSPSPRWGEGQGEGESASAYSPSSRPSPQEGEGVHKEGFFKIALVDYGATATISPQMKAGITLFVEGLIKKDTRILSSAMKQMGFVAREDREEAFEKVVDYFYGKIRGIKIENFREINIAQFQNLGDILELKKMDISFRELTSTFHVPKDWILLERALILMMGLTTHLDPHLNPVDIVLPYVEELVLGKDKKGADLILTATKEVLLSYINLPAEIHRVLKKLQEGKISFVSREQKEHSERIYAAAHQLIYALFVVFCGSMGYLFYQQGDPVWFDRMKWATGIFGALLGLSFVRNRK